MRPDASLMYPPHLDGKLRNGAFTKVLCQFEASGVEIDMGVIALDAGDLFHALHYLVV